MEDKSKGQPESPASIGAEGEEEGASLRAAQEKNSKLAALSTENFLNLMDVYSMRMALDTLVNFYEYDAFDRKETNS